MRKFGLSDKMVTYLKDHGVQFHYETKVVDVKFDINGKRKQASSVVVEHAGRPAPSA